MGDAERGSPEATRDRAPRNCAAVSVRKGRVQTVTLMWQSMLARTGDSEGATEGCGSLLLWRSRCALVVEQLTAALELFGRQLRQNLREVAADGGSERGSNWRVDCQSP
jgi:hypothetical protein